MKENKKQIVIATSVLVVTTILLLGLTYAYYKTRINGNTKDKSISVVSKKLEITYADGNGVISPTEKIEPGYTTTKTFTVENTGDQTLSYSIKLDNITNTFSRTEDWTYVLKKGETEVSSGVLPITESYILNTISIDSKTTDSYSLTIIYANLTDVDQSVDMGKELSLRVNIDEAVGTMFESASEGTLLKAIGNDNLISKTLTTPAVTPSSETEAVFTSTEDDYGTSYYFRGNVKNNFINFSGMCWRIVRVQGDGSIKITLADRDHECNSSDYSTSLSNSAFVSVLLDTVGTVDTFTYKYNREQTSNDLKYETSDIKILLETWLNGGDYTTGSYTGTFEKKIDDSKLVEAEWCNDMSISSKQYYDENHYEINDASKAVYTDHYYGVFDRLAKTYQPTFKCNMTGLDGTKSLKIKSKVGTLTADEVVFAGGGKRESNYYLKDNVDQEYWTMSPGAWDDRDGIAYVYRVSWLGELYELDFGIANTVHSVRPVVVLKSDIEITEGNGTQANPYVIN